ncbi:MAG: VOC family protein [Gammaproteobacteria bacterium]|nr:VOC family protein [Gammaproteobacteria bacterium]
MTEEPRPLNRMPWLVPNLTVKDVGAAANFYSKAFSFFIKGTTSGEDDSDWHAELQYKDQIIILSKEGIPGKTTSTPNNIGLPSSMNLYFYCEDVDKIFHQALLAGAQVKTQPIDTQWGDRIAVVSDLDGYYWVIATAHKQMN